jgi:hypothetical protein
MKVMADLLLVVCGMVIGAGAYALITGNEIAKARSLCEETGGQLLVTEYNSKTGLTMNCFYPVDDSIIAPAQMDL